MSCLIFKLPISVTLSEYFLITLSKKEPKNTKIINHGSRLMFTISEPKYNLIKNPKLIDSELIK